MHDLKVGEALHTDASVAVLFVDLSVVFEVVKDLAVVSAAHLVQLRFLLTGEQIRISGTERSVMIPEILILLIHFGMRDAHPLDAVRRVHLRHVRIPCAGMVFLVQLDKLLRKLAHVGS